ncbi:hypothetical protein KFK09_026703 [Dendrobium nobile]|uniref:Uncharacterized protein n=1 Tax=Dendrobium nobile TaxID=94219 RepID=A0A8T3A8W3_DENNO|nr:hypothetical protein KFK09_026703 [Dendrobium nobile]
MEALKSKSPLFLSLPLFFSPYTPPFSCLGINVGKVQSVLSKRKSSKGKQQIDVQARRKICFCF